VKNQGPARNGCRAAVFLSLCALLFSPACVRKPEASAPATGRESIERSQQPLLAQGFQETTVWSGLERPTAVRFAPDGRVFVAEKRGRILVFDNLDDPTPTEFAQLDPRVHDYWDRGLLGLALHPQFPAQPYVYVLYSLDAKVGETPPIWNDECPTPPGPNDDGCVIGARLSRLQAAGNVSTGTETVLLEDWGQQYPSHSVGDLVFGADGALYVSAGDGASFTFVDYGQRGNPLADPPSNAVGGAQTPPLAEGGALRSQSPRRMPGRGSLDGTVLRLDPMTGAALPDNPLFASADDRTKRIVAYGLRNPFRMTRRPSSSNASGELWIGDVGWSTWEEINVVANPADGVVENFGWPCYEGRDRQPVYDGANLNLCERLYGEANAVQAPFFTYNHGDRLVAGERCQIGGSSIAGLAFYSGDRFPEKYRGALFFLDHSRGCAWVMLPGPDGVPDPARIEAFGSDLGRPVDLQMGPDGNLYYVDHATEAIDGGQVRRISYLQPHAVAIGRPTAGPPPLVVSFDGSGSIKALPTDTLSFAWDLDGDGQFDDADGETPATLYRTAGTVSARLRVTDQRGTASVSDPITITVSETAMVSTPPVPVIDVPAANLTWRVGDAIAFSGHATDAEDGPLPASALSWLLVMQHCPSGCHAHVIQSWNGVAGATFSTPDHELPSHIELVLVATDSSGIRRSTSVRLDPQTVLLTLQTQPPGLPLAVGLQSFAAPFGRELILGGRTSVAAAPIQRLDALPPYAFVSWSDGLAPTHDLGPLTADQTLIATYRPAGLTGQYFDALDFADPKLLRIDPDISFDWGRASPDPALGPETFSVRWTGFVVAPTTDLYRFTTDSDDGIRLWVNGIPVINAWTVHPLQRNSGIPFPLLAGQKARIQLEYFDNEFEAVAKLYWSSRTQPLAIIPTEQLYPGCAAGACPAGLACINDECVVAPCPAGCATGQRCEAGQCVDACQNVVCQGGKCLAGVCVPRCQGVTCPTNFACQPSTGMCEDQCRDVSCPAGQTCSAGTCRPTCQVNGCPPTANCNATTGACDPKCQGVSCEPGFGCVPETGACQDSCLTLTCPGGQACQGGECKPACVVRGCATTEMCNTTTGACQAKCAMITCAPGAECVPTTGQCEDRCRLGNITCQPNFECSLGACQPRCAREGCATTETCNATTGLCVARCQGVTCEAGFECVPTTGQCAEICRMRSCPVGQVCSVGECKPTCAVNGCPNTAVCNPTTGACDSRCQGVTCNSGFVCKPSTGVCEDLCNEAPPTCPENFDCSVGACKPRCSIVGCDGTDLCNTTTGLCGPRPDGGSVAGTDAGVMEGSGSPDAGGVAGDGAGSRADARPTIRGTRGDGCDCDVGGRGDGGVAVVVLFLMGAVLRRRRMGG
jgi:glucose/arabinose dehydrogenase/PKD repeat protein